MAFDPNYDDYPAEVREALKAVGGIQILSKQSGVSPPTVRKVLLNQPSNSRVFREAAEKRIAKTLGVPVSAFGRNDP